VPKLIGQHLQEFVVGDVHLDAAPEADAPVLLVDRKDTRHTQAVRNFDLRLIGSLWLMLHWIAVGRLLGDGGDVKGEQAGARQLLSPQERSMVRYSGILNVADSIRVTLTQLIDPPDIVFPRSRQMVENAIWAAESARMECRVSARQMADRSNE